MGGLMTPRSHFSPQLDSMFLLRLKGVKKKCLRLQSIGADCRRSLALNGVIQDMTLQNGRNRGVERGTAQG
jgi:hypothetical protein